MKRSIIHLSVILLISIVLSYPSFTNLTFLPSGIDTPAHLFKIKFIKDAFLKFKTIPAWDNNWYGGYPIFSLYPPLPYIIPAFADIIINNITLTYNIFRFLFYLFLSLLGYVLIRKVSRDEDVALMASILVLTSYPILNNNYTIGRFPTSLGLLFFLLGIYLLLKEEIYKKSFSRYIFLLAGTIAVFLQIHPMLFYLFVISAVPLMFLFMLKYKRYMKIFVKNFLFVIIFFLIFNFQFLSSFIRNFFIQKPFWISYQNIKVEFFYSRVFGDTFPLYIGIFHILLFMLGLMYSIFKKNFIVCIFGCLCILFFILTFGKNLPIYYYLPFKEQFDLARFQLISSLFMALTGSLGVKLTLDQVRKIKNSTIEIYLTLGFLVFILVRDVFPATYEATNWKPNFECGEFKLNTSYRGLAIRFRHWDSYLLPTCFRLENIMGWFQQSDPHYNFTQTLESIGGLWYAHDERFVRNQNMTLFKNLLRLSNTKYIFFGKNWYPSYAKEVTVGSYQVDHGWNKEFRDFVNNDSKFKIIFSSNALEIFEYTENFTYCEPIEPVWINENYYINAVNFLSTENAFPKVPVFEEPINLNSSTNVSVECKKETPETIHIKVNKPSWILVKESYYPFWRAESGSKIYNAFGFMVIYVNLTETLLFR